MNLHILITCLDESRIGLATLAFKTLRVGFPTANVMVCGNGFVSQRITDAVADETERVGGAFQNIGLISHGAWIEYLITHERSPFWITDSDTVLFDKVEHWFDGSDSPFSGRYEPEFIEPWTKTVHVARLHPSMMWINPALLRAAIRGWPWKPEFFDSVQKQLIQWHWVPRDGRLEFYDTMAGLWHAGLGGVPFTDEQNAAFEHLFCGSYAHLTPLAERLSAVHQGIIANPQAAKGLWAKQQEWYAANKV